MDRMSLDLGTAREKLPIIMNRWKYLFIGECSGDVSIRLGSSSASPLNPSEFDKLTEIDMFKYLYISNDAQSGKELNIYYEEEPKVVEINKNG